MDAKFLSIEKNGKKLPGRQYANEIFKRERNFGEIYLVFAFYGEEEEGKVKPKREGREGEREEGTRKGLGEKKARGKR